MRSILIRRIRIISPAILCLLLLLSGPPVIPAATMKTTAVVSIGKWKAVRIRNVPINSLVTIGIKSSQGIMTFLLSKKQMKIFPKVKDAFLIARVHRQFSSKIILKNEGNYYLLVLNKNSTAPATVTIAVQVQPVRSLRLESRPIY